MRLQDPESHFRFLKMTMETFYQLLKSEKLQTHMVKLLLSHVNFIKSCSNARLATCSYARTELFSIHALRGRALHTCFGVHNFVQLRIAPQRNAMNGLA